MLSSQSATCCASKRMDVRTRKNGMCPSSTSLYNVRTAMPSRSASSSTVRALVLVRSCSTRVILNVKYRPRRAASPSYRGDGPSECGVPIWFLDCPLFGTHLTASLQPLPTWGERQGNSVRAEDPKECRVGEERRVLAGRRCRDLVVITCGEGILAFGFYQSGCWVAGKPLAFFRWGLA